MKVDKAVEKYRNQFGTEKEQKEQLAFLDINQQAGNHPYFNARKSMKIKNKRKGKRI